MRDWALWSKFENDGVWRKDGHVRTKPSSLSDRLRQSSASVYVNPINSNGQISVRQDICNQVNVAAIYKGPALL